MPLERGQELTRGVRRTNLENSFGVVKTSSASLGQIGGKLAETMEKITLFQADVMDKEWQNNFDTKSSLFIAEETNKELNSPNPNLVSLQQKLLTYKDKTLQDAPDRFQNYINNKLDISFAENINLVKDYSNNLKFTNLYSETQKLGEDILNNTSTYIDQIIKNNSDNPDYINELIENHYLNVVTPNINRFAKNYETLSNLKPLKVTPTDIANEVRSLQVDFTAEKLIAKMKTIMAVIDIDNHTGVENSILLQKANESIENLVEQFVTDPSSRDISNLSDAEVANIEKKLKAEKDRILGFHTEKVAQANVASDYISSESAKETIKYYKTNPQVALTSDFGSVFELLSNDPYLTRDPTLFAKVFQESTEAITIHQTLNNIKNEYNGNLPETSVLKNLIKNRTSIELNDDQISDYVFNMFGTSQLSTIDYMQIVNDMEKDPYYGKKIDQFKTENQIQLEKNNIIQRSVFERNLELSFFPKDSKDLFIQVDAILTKDQITEGDLQIINDAFKFYRITKGKVGDKLYEQRLGIISDFFEYLDETRGEAFADIVTTDIGSLRSMVNEYREFLQKPYSIEEANNFMIDNDLTYISSEVIGQNILNDINSQFGFSSIGNWIRNKIPESLPFGLSSENKKVKTNSYTDLFNISGTKKIALGILSPVIPGSLEQKIISVDPIVESQLQNQYMVELSKVVDFTLIGKNDGKLKEDIKKHQAAALDRAVRFLRDNNFGISKYERQGTGYKLTYDPLDDKIPYESDADKDRYIAIHFLNRVKDMENKYTIEQMMEWYPDLYYSNFGTDQENRVEFDLERAFELAIEQDGVYFTREPGTDVYRYNLDNNVFINSRNELDGDIGEDQFFRPDDVLMSGGQLISTESIVGGAIRKYLDTKPPIASMLDQIGIDESNYESFLYTIFYPGVKLMTSEEEILNYIEKQSSSITGKIE